MDAKVVCQRDMTCINPDEVILRLLILKIHTQTIFELA